MGSIVGLQFAQIQQMASEYEEKVCETEKQRDLYSKENEALIKDTSYIGHLVLPHTLTR